MSGRERSNETYNSDFAAYYDKITGHKDYVSEVDALDQLIRSSVDEPNPRLLDVGCGTGHHARLLSAKGYEVTAIDLSPDMIRIAKLYESSVTFQSGNIDEVSPSGFGFCYSLFNVINCLGSIEELVRFFAAIHGKLVPMGGLLVEGWNAVAVIAAPPQVVERTYDLATERIVRRVTPSTDFMNQRLSLDYQIEVFPLGKNAAPVKSFAVVHELVLFTPIEISYCLKRAGFRNIMVRTALPELVGATTQDRMLAITAKK